MKFKYLSVHLGKQRWEKTCGCPNGSPKARMPRGGMCIQQDSQTDRYRPGVKLKRSFTRVQPDAVQTQSEGGVGSLDNQVQQVPAAVSTQRPCSEQSSYNMLLYLLAPQAL